ncbi:MAG: response regulator, partial [Balneola sp.]
NNLVSNALKFTEKGYVKIFVQCVAEKNKKVDVEFKVSDTGIGIEESRLDSIFESFVQADKKTKRLYGGTGLGLSISKKLVELQNGSISAKSTLDKGSEFIVLLTFGKPENKENTDAGRVETQEENIEGLKVIVAEDNLVNQKVMQSFLRKWKVDATIVSNGLEAIEALKSNEVDLILMDLEMPEMDGYEAATAIRNLEDATKKNIPIIALTAAALNEVKEKVYSVGMNDFVTKPFNPVELRRKLSEINKAI